MAHSKFERDRQVDEHPRICKNKRQITAGRKKIPRKNGVFKRVINDISGFSRVYRYAPHFRTLAFLAEPETFRIARFTRRV